MKERLENKIIKASTGNSHSEESGEILSSDEILDPKARPKFHKEFSDGFKKNQEQGEPLFVDVVEEENQRKIKEAQEKLEQVETKGTPGTEEQLKNSLRKLKGLPGVDGSGGTVGKTSDLSRSSMPELKPRPQEVKTLKPTQKTLGQRIKSLFGFGSAKEDSNDNDSAINE